MPIRTVCDGRITLPESIRAAFELLPGDPMVYNVRGSELVLTRATPPRSALPPRSRRPGRVLPWSRRKPRRASSAD